MLYVFAVFAVTYVVGIPAYGLLKGLQSSAGTNLPHVNDFFMKFGPSLAGILLVGYVAGAAGVRQLLGRLLRWQQPPGRYLAVIAIPPALFVLTLVLRGHSAALRDVSTFPAMGVFASQLAITTLLGGGLGEELGWRGFMLPQLCKRYSPLVASCLVAGVWFAWHVPAYVFASKGESDPMLPFAAIVIPFSIVLTWAYYRSGESLLMPVLLHGSINASFYTMETLLPDVVEARDFQPGYDWTLAFLAWLVAIGVMIRWRTRVGRPT